MTNHMVSAHAITDQDQAVWNIGHRDSKPDLFSNQTLAASLTRTASTQTYYTIRFLVDRNLVPDAFRAYAYFRWVDDTLDQAGKRLMERIAFANRQAIILDRCYRGDLPNNLTVEERMLADLIQNDRGKTSGLQSYIRNMMAVMVFDADRRDRLISQNELADYTGWLATSVTEALHYFIGHGSNSPQSEARYLAATAAHITHMLRDTFEDTSTGYFNIPREVLEVHGIAPQDITSDPYRAWVRSRVRLAREYFQAGKGYLGQVENRRCRLAGYAYIARFEWVLDAIERDNYVLRPEYAERKSMASGVRMARTTILLAANCRRQGSVNWPLTAR
jgi:phytoene/squalene synthetase